MPKKAIELGPLAVSKITKPGLHFVGGVAGLALQVESTGAKSWILRATIGSKRRDMGLGGFPDVTLADAREAARQARQLIKTGVDPINKNRTGRAMLKLAQANAVPFRKAAGAYIETHEAGWKNPKHIQQWRNSLEAYAFPVIGDLLVSEVELPQVMSILEPIWRSKTETATRVRSRLEAVLDWATTKGYREGMNPARWKGHLANLLPAPSKITKERHHPAMPITEVGEFMTQLRQQDGVGARALEFGILTAARSGEIRGATRAEIDVKQEVWIISADRMKMDREHRVPLCRAAIELVVAQLGSHDSDLIFPAPRGGTLSDGTLNAVLRRMGRPYVQHGFRSTFRDWASERTQYPREVAEMALAHAIENKVEAAYRRGDLFMKRKKMMDEWSDFVSRHETTGEVVHLPTRTA